MLLAHLGTGVFAPLQLFGVTFFAAIYAIRLVSLGQQGRPIPGWRVVCYFSGIALIMIAFVSPLGHVGEELLWVHMVQHLVIGDIAALLIVLGLTRSVLAPVLAIRFFDRLRVLGLPYIALPLWIANLFIWHIPVLYEGAVNHSGIHALEHACFIGFGIALWMPVAGPLPVPRWFGGGAQVGYTVIARLAGAVLGNIFMWSGTVLYPVYLTGDRYWGISPVTDQGIAGIVMLIESGIVTLAVLAWAMLRWAERDSEKQRLLDLADSLGVPLDDARADRAVASGHGARLEERLRSS
ncbi:cytochrome c oxidase assembly protein [soil metagenome]